MKQRATTLALLAAMGPAQAEDYGARIAAASEVSLVPGFTEPSGLVRAGLTLTLAPGWKTYWRAPGSAGIPPLFDWSGSENVAAFAVEWPVPEVFDQSGQATLGYASAVTFPLVITPVAPGAPVTLALEIDYGICELVCVPVRAQVAGAVGQGTRLPVEIARLALPARGTASGLTHRNCALSPSGEDYALTAELTFSQMPGVLDHAAVELGDPGAYVTGPVEVMQTNGRVRLTAPVRTMAPGAFQPDFGALRFTLLGSAGGIDIQGC